MKIIELINENISAHTTIAAIVNDIGNSVNRTYEALGNLAQKLADDQGSLKGYPMLAGGIGSRWYQSFYVNRLQSELYDLVKYAPNATKELTNFLKQYPESFGDVASALPDILLQVAKRINNQGLGRAAHAWIERREKHLSFVAKLRQQLKDDNDEYRAQNAPSKPKSNGPSAAGKQASAAEELVNNVLKGLPKEQASEIRAAIAKSDNKIQALQRELVKRGINI